MTTQTPAIEPARWNAVPAGGVELVRGVAGNNPHTLVADPGTCRWTSNAGDRAGLGIALFENTEPAYLVHPEHGASGVAPGRWMVRRQQERGHGTRTGFGASFRPGIGLGSVLVAD